jgi:hypothetical protein
MTQQMDMYSSRTTKIDRYKWNVKDGPGIQMMIDKQDLHVSPEYQRELTQGKVLKMASSWSWIACNVITVGLRDGLWWVIDGQHRVMAAMRRTDITELPCIVFEIDDVRNEARGFLDINDLRKPMTSVDRLRASAVAGDEAAQQFGALCTRLGVTLSKNAHAPGTLKSAGWGMQRMAEDPIAATIVMELAVELCATDHIMIMEKLLGGLWYLHKYCEVGLTDVRLRQRIRTRGAKVLVDEANKASAFYSRGGYKIWAIGMLNAINKGLRTRFKMRDYESDQP